MGGMKIVFRQQKKENARNTISRERERPDQESSREMWDSERGRKTQAMWQSRTMSI